MTDRENFEAWWQVEFHNGNPPRRGWDYYWHGEDYADEELSGLWKAWRAALDSQQPADDGWIEWAGSYENEPVAEHTPVNVKYRDGSVSAGFSTSFTWGHRPNKPSWDIIAYRVVKP